MLMDSATNPDGSDPAEGNVKLPKILLNGNNICMVRRVGGEEGWWWLANIHRWFQEEMARRYWRMNSSADIEGIMGA